MASMARLKRFGQMWIESFRAACRKIDLYMLVRVFRSIRRYSNRERMRLFGAAFAVICVMTVFALVLVSLPFPCIVLVVSAEFYFVSWYARSKRE